jgi:hypothetical protein
MAELSDMARFNFSQQLCMCILAQLCVPQKALLTSCCLADYGEIERREEKQAFCTLLNFFRGKRLYECDSDVRTTEMR